jgi:hypothetical protein
MQVIYPPISNEDWSGFHVFLAGSIEMGQAADWQQSLINSLSDLSDDLILMNPRRKDWDSSWIQSIDNINFKQQVDWELSHLESADLAVFYFDPKTKAPITLMELGLCCGRGEPQSVVCCPEGYWRRGNVEILCNKSEITFLDNLDQLSKHIREEFVEYETDLNTMIERYKAMLVDLENGV